MRHARRFLARTVIAPALTLIAAFGPLAHADRQDALAVMETMTRGPNDVRLRASIETAAGETPVHHVGDDLRFNLQTSQDAHIYIVRIDDNGVGWLTVPRLDRGNLLRGNAPGVYPNDGNPRLVARPPLGPMTTYVIATPRPIERIPNSAEAEIEIGVAREKFEELRQQLLAASDGRPLGAIKLEHEVKARRGDTQFTASDLVAYFTTTTRALHRPKIAADIRFEFNSARLTPEARKNLTEWGAALSDPGLQGMKFRLAGHTDDIGPDDVNMKLSRARAAAVKEHLQKEHRIDSDRLTIEAFGKSAPLMKGTSKEARAANRRVEFEMQR